MGLKAWAAQKRKENLRHTSIKHGVSSAVSDDHLIKRYKVFRTKMGDLSLGVHEHLSS